MPPIVCRRHDSPCGSTPVRRRRGPRARATRVPGGRHGGTAAERARSELPAHVLDWRAFRPEDLERVRRCRATRGSDAGDGASGCRGAPVPGRAAHVGRLTDRHRRGPGWTTAPRSARDLSARRAPGTPPSAAVGPVPRHRPVSRTDRPRAVRLRSSRRAQGLPLGPGPRCRTRARAPGARRGRVAARTGPRRARDDRGTTAAAGCTTASRRHPQRRERLQHPCRRDRGAGRAHAGNHRDHRLRRHDPHVDRRRAGNRPRVCAARQA